jgi:hypothetical protein
MSCETSLKLTWGLSFFLVCDQNLGCKEVVVHTLWLVRANEPPPHWLDLDTCVQVCLLVSWLNLGVPHEPENFFNFNLPLIKITMLVC